MGAVGSTLLILQFALTILGFGHHDFDTGSLDADSVDVDHGGDVDGHDVDGHDQDAGHGDGSAIFRMLSFRALVAASTFFGWSGLAATESGLSTMRAVSVAFGAGLLSMYLVAWFMHALTKLHAEGNVQIGQTIGANGTVYLSIPGKREGVGKVHVNVQQRTMEYNAVTADDKLPTGMPIVVVGVVDSETLEVRPAPRMEVIE
jgi:membrane protein implicated in regulation of membrane protease activity